MTSVVWFFDRLGKKCFVTSSQNIILKQRSELKFESKILASQLNEMGKVCRVEQSRVRRGEDLIERNPV